MKLQLTAIPLLATAINAFAQAAAPVRAALPVPSLVPELPAIPARVVTTPPLVILRIVLLEVSAT